MFKCILLLLMVVAALVGPRQCQKARQDPLKIRYDFIHPTFDYARTYIDTTNNARQPRPILKTSNITGNGHKPVQMWRNELLGFEEKTADLRQLIAGSAETSLLFGQTGIGITGYRDEQERLKAYIAAGLRGDWLSSQDDCAKSITTRAFEMWVLDINDTETTFYVALSIDQGGVGCFLAYVQNLVPQHSSLFAPGFVQSSILLEEMPITRYKIASMWAYQRARDGPVDVGIIDEAGFVYYMALDSSLRRWLNRREIVSLSAIILEPNEEFDYRFNFTTPYESKEVRWDIESITNATGSSLSLGPVDTMRMHYQHSFVEAITLIDGSLCWSTGTGHNPHVNLLNCFIPQAKEEPLPNGLLNVPQRDISIRALESYEYNGRYYLHINYARWSGDLISRRNLVGYYYCEANSTAELRLEQFKPFGDQRPTQRCLYHNFTSNMMPIDIVYLPECKQLAVLYQHMFTLHPPGGPIEGPGVLAEAKYKVVDWMTGPLNAVLYAKGRLYLFMSGSEIVISKELTSDGSCGLQKVVKEDEFTQSRVLLRYDDQINLRNRSDLVPAYDSVVHKTATSTVNNSWTTDLVVLKLLPESLALPVNPADISPSPNPVPGPKPKPGNSTSIIIVIIIVIIIIGIVCGSVYYFCCGTSDEPIRRPKSALRKLKTLGAAVAGGPGAKALQPMKQVAVGSSLTPHDTVRSDLLQSKHKSKLASKSMQKADALKTVSATRSVKSVKSRRSPGPPASPKSKSRGPSSSKRSSPNLSASPKKSSPSPNLISKKSSPGANLITNISSPGGAAVSTLSKQSPSSPKSPQQPLK